MREALLFRSEILLKGAWNAWIQKYASSKGTISVTLLSYTRVARFHAVHIYIVADIKRS